MSLGIITTGTFRKCFILNTVDLHVRLIHYLHALALFVAVNRHESLNSIQADKFSYYKTISRGIEAPVYVVTNEGPIYRVIGSPGGVIADESITLYNE